MKIQVLMNGRAERVVVVEIDDLPGRIDDGGAALCVPLFRDGNTHQVVVKLDSKPTFETPGDPP